MTYRHLSTDGGGIVMRVTVIVETDDQYTKVYRQGDSGSDLAVLLSQCLSGVAERCESSRLDAIVEAAAKVASA